MGVTGDTRTALGRPDIVADPGLGLLIEAGVLVTLLVADEVMGVTLPQAVDTIGTAMVVEETTTVNVALQVAVAEVPLLPTVFPMLKDGSTMIPVCHPVTLKSTAEPFSWVV